MIMRDLRASVIRRGLARVQGMLHRSKPFHLVFFFAQHEYTYSFAVGCLASYVKQEIPGIRLSLVSVLNTEDLAATVRRVVKLKPDLIAVTCMSPLWPFTRRFLSEVRRALKLTPVVVGGTQAIVAPDETLGQPGIDYICVGDGEEALVELVRRLQGERDPLQPIEGLWEKRSNQEIVKTQPALADLSRTPLPDYSIFEKEGDIRWLSSHAIESRKLKTLHVMTGRGCPYRCTYCSNTTLLDLYGPKFLRRYQPERVIEQLVSLRDRYSVDYLKFMDEMFLNDMDYVYKFLALYRERVRLPFSIFARVEKVDDEFCRVAADAGCHSIWFGVESGSEEYRRRYLRRHMTNQQIMQASEAARRAGIRRFVFNMVGMPFETRENLLETLEFTKRLQPELVVFIQFLPLPGSPLYERARQNGLLVELSEEKQMWSVGQMNIREHAGAATAAELNEILQEMLQYANESSRYDP
ncbi:MAG: radical SAM protein [Acidobacteria bacterium]|nr:MAG: radical SAM protein [Acidobacteriota bacterium]